MGSLIQPEILSHIIVELFLIFLLCFREMTQNKERSQLLDRLMSKDLTEYSGFEIARKQASIKPKMKRNEIQL